MLYSNKNEPTITIDGMELLNMPSESHTTEKFCRIQLLSSANASKSNLCWLKPLLSPPPQRRDMRESSEMLVLNVLSLDLNDASVCAKSLNL